MMDAFKEFFDIVGVFFVLYMIGYASFLFLAVTVGTSELYQMKRRNQLKNELLGEYYVPVTIVVPEVSREWAAPPTPVTDPMETQWDMVTPEPSRLTMPSPAQILSGTWLSGALGMLLWHGTGYLLARRRLRSGSWEEPGDQALLAALWGGEHGQPEVLRTGDTEAPLSLGLFQPLVCGDGTGGGSAGAPRGDID